MVSEKLVNKVTTLIEGNGEESILMIHGWPDTPAVWDAQVEHFKQQYRCVRITLPGFDGPQSRETYTIEQIVELIKDVIDQHCGGQAVLMVHDWGAMFGYQFYNHYPDKVSKIIGVDIGDSDSFGRYLKKAPILNQLDFLSYQMRNVATWFMGRLGGDTLTRHMASKKFNAPEKPEAISASMNWPYYMLWFGGKDSYQKTFRAFQPDCPFLFIYGEDKSALLHDPQWAAALATKAHNATVALPCDHWVMVRLPERFNQVVGDWLNTTA